MAPNAYFSPAAFRSASRGRLGGRWLWFMGDSAIRGLYVALLQQLTYRDGDSQPILVETRTSNSSAMAWGPHGWIDIVLEEGEDGRWVPLAQTASTHDCPRALGGKQRCQPARDRSSELAAAWCTRARGRQRLRLSYRQLTFLSFASDAINQSAAAWQLTRCRESEDPAGASAVAPAGPDGILFQSGWWDIEHSWDAHHRRPSEAYLHDALLRLRRIGRGDRSGHARVKLTYASLGLPGQRADLRGAYLFRTIEEF